MATLEVKIYKIAIEEHPNADTLELAKIGEYRSIVRKGMYQTGDLVAYIPCGAVLPQDIIDTLGLGKLLAGKNHDRVKEIKLRGILSEGLVYPTEEVSPLSMKKTLIYRDNGEFQIEVHEGDEVSAFLGIVKYEPPIPTCMAGEVYNAGTECTVKYDVENYKKFPYILEDGEEVVFTEKLHGTFMQFGSMSADLANPEHFDGRCIVASKGLGSRGLCFKHNEANKHNVYVRTMHQEKLYDIPALSDNQVWVLGEVFGSGVQDLEYGFDNGAIGFRVFDVKVGGTWMNDAQVEQFCLENDLERVPVLYRGPFSKEIMLEHAYGRETVSGMDVNIREGIVMRPVIEREHNEIGRVQLKYVNDDYLSRKGKNLTENS